MTTEAALTSWLLDESAIRTVLIEVGVKSGGSETTRYLSNRSYFTSPTDTPSNKHYLPLITGGIEFTESIDIDGNFSINYGDIELDNTNGEIDEWIDDVWENRSINVFIGDITWERTDFYQIFSGVTAGIDVRNRNTFNLKIADKLQRLNTTLSEAKVGDLASYTEESEDSLVPVCLGEPHNVSPVLLDSGTDLWCVHLGEVEQITEVRDNGVPVEFTDNADGTFTLNQASYGTITASVQGATLAAYGGYFNDAPTIIKYVVQHLIPVAKRFSDAEIDLTNFASIKASYPHPCGVYLADKANALDVCNTLAASIGCRLTITRAGKLKLVRLALPRSDVGTEITAKDMVKQSLEIESLPDVVAAVKLGYAKNWTVQESLTTGIPTPHIELYAQEWWTVTRTDSVITADYGVIEDPDQRDTYLITEAAAITEANNELAMKSERRKILKYTGLPHLLTQHLGATQTITHSRFGLSSGVAGQIVSIKSDWMNMRAEISVYI